MVETRQSKKKYIDIVYEKYEDKLAKKRKNTSNVMPGLAPKVEVVELDVDKQVIVQFKDPEGKEVGAQLSVPAEASKADLNKMLEAFLEEKNGPAEEFQVYQFYLEDKEVKTSVQEILVKQQIYNAEMVLPLTFRPESMFRIRPVTRASSTLQGHTNAVLNAAFSPDGTLLASASGDRTVRLWDLNTESPEHTLSGHNGWVMYVAFSPDGSMLASAGADNNVLLWDPETGEQIGHALKGHKKFVTSLSWEPLVSATSEKRLASSSKDHTVRIWWGSNNSCQLVLGSHTSSITKVLWGGEGLLYSASQDRTIKVWNASNGAMVAELNGHAHWVNTLALSTDYVLRTGCFDHKRVQFGDWEEKKKYALERYEKARDPKGEILVSGSDDITMFMWQPKKQSKSLARLTGHQGLIIQVCFSPDGFFFASASFDKSIKLWEGKTGKFITTFRGHVASVYQVAWSADSRMLVSGSKDTTLKVWDVEKRKLMFDLPGHSDEVYAVDWSPDGDRVVSGSKDHMLRIWRN